MTGFEYANARVKGLKSFLISDNDMKIALELKSTSDLAVWMESTPYRPVMEGKSMADIDRALFRDWVNTSEKMMRLVPKNTYEFFRALMSTYENEALKLLVNSKNGVAGEVKLYSVFLSKRLKHLDKKLIEAESVEAMADILDDTEYGKLMKECLAEKKDISKELDRYYFTRLWTALEKLPKKSRKTARNLIGTEIDSINMMDILRSVMKKNEIDDVIPAYHRLRKSTVRECMKADSISSIVSILGATPYGGLLQEALQKHDKDSSLFHFEHILKKHVMSMYGRAVLDVLGIGVPLAYLRLKGREITNIRSIAIGLENGLDKAIIEEMMM